jgi:hypothetical protein
MHDCNQVIRCLPSFEFTRLTVTLWIFLSEQDRSASTQNAAILDGRITMLLEQGKAPFPSPSPVLRHFIP